jgi:hypothetical protein
MPFCYFLTSLTLLDRPCSRAPAARPLPARRREGGG